MTKEAFNEIQILQSCAAGDAAAFEVIVHKYQSLVCAITFSAVGQVEKSEELAQQVFINAWKNLAQLQDFDKFKAWLIGITRNVIRTFYRTQKRDIVNNAASLEEVGDRPDTSSEPLKTVISKEQEAIVYQSLEQIPEMYREPMVLFYRQQQSTRQVAEALDLTEETVRTRLMRGRKMLKEQVAQMVESTLSHTGPGKAFTTMVVASIAGLALTGTTATAASGSATGAATAGTATGLATVMSTITAKIITAAAVVAVAVGAVLTYQHLTKPEQPARQSNEIAVVKDEQEPAATPENTEALQPEASNIAAAAIEGPENIMAASQNSINAESTLDTETVSISQTTEIPENSQYVFEPNGILSGLVTESETGAPIIDTEIWISCGRIYQTKTDKHGFYSFDKIEKKENYTISIHSWDHIGIGLNADRPPTVNLENGKQVTRHFQLKRACMVELTVVDEDGKPIKGAVVHVSRLSDSQGWQVGPKDGEDHNTNKDGFILLGGLIPNDTYYITVQHSYWVNVKGRKNFKTHRFDYAPTGMELFLGDPNTIEIVEMVLEKGQTVRGYAQYQDGEPASDITIVPEPEWWRINKWIPSFEVEPNGFFTLDHIVPGTYNIQARIPQGDGWSGRKVLRTDLPLNNSAVLYVKLPFNSPKNLASISGIIKWTSEKRPRHIEIDAYSAAYGHFSTRLWNFEKETFKIERMMPGTYQVKVEGNTIEPVTIQNVQAPTENLVLELTCVDRPRLFGMVIDSVTKKALPRYDLRVRKLQTLRGPHYTQSGRWFTFERENGTFEIEVVGPGVYDIQVRAQGFVSTWSKQINTDKNEAVEITLSSGGGRISGKVLDKNGRPVSRATVIPLSKACGTSYSTKHVFVSHEGSVTTNDNGEFLLTELAAGQETLKVSHPNYTFVIRSDIEVENGQCAEGISITLPKGGIIEGIVYDHNGQPHGGVAIRAQNEMGYSTASDDPSILATAISEPNGFYQITGLPEDVCYLMRQDEWNSLGVVRRTIAPENGKKTRVDFGGTNMLRGQIILEGQPLANQKVIISNPSSYYSGFLKAVATTDAEGRFVFRGIAPGNYGIFYAMNRQRSDWYRLTEFEMKGEDYDLGVVPKESAILYLTIQQPTDVPWEISSVYFKSETQGSSIAIPYDQAMNPDEPYKVGPVTPGLYSISVNRSDEVSYNQKIEILENVDEVVETIMLPSGDAAIYGTVAEGFDYVGLQSQDKSITVAIRKQGKDNYVKSNLPAGDYRVGLFGMPEDGGVIVNLTDGQELELNIDRSLLSIQETESFATVSVASEAGVLVHNAKVQLFANGKTIEPLKQMGWQKIFLAAPGEYLLRVSHEGYQVIEKQIMLKPTPEGESPNIRQNQLLIRLQRLEPK